MAGDPPYHSNAMLLLMRLSMGVFSIERNTALAVSLHLEKLLQRLPDSTKSFAEQLAAQ